MDYVIADAHCDTLQKICDLGGKLNENSFQLDIKRLKSRKCKSVQVFAAFIDKKTDTLPPFLRAKELIEKYYAEINENSEIVLHCNNVSEISEALQRDKIAAMLSIEGGEAVGGSLEKLRYFYDMGVRIMTLCWNYANEIADGITEPGGLGLTSFGEMVVREMNNLGMLIDVSHISEKGFWDVIEKTEKPVAATHSNVKALKNHPRNLSDGQIKAIIENDGFIGINFYTEFLSNGMCRIKNIINHIEYILSLGGENNIGFGSDFDGMSSLPEKICGAEDTEKLIDEFLRLGYSENLIKKLTSGNFLRVLDAVIK